MTPDRTKAARDLLAFYMEAGADALVGEAPVDRLADAGSPETARPPVRDAGRAPVPRHEAAKRPRPEERSGESRPEGRPAQVASPPPPEEAAMAARTAAKSAATLDDLRAILEGFQGCALRATASRLVFSDGNPQSRLMFVGEAPGRDEDIQGLPFVGVSGKLLDRMLAAIGLDRKSVYIANIVPWRPPGNRTPTPQEAAICLPFILRQIELANPDVLVCLGGPSMQTLLGFKDGIKKMRGRWLAFNTGTREIRAMATFHPAFLLRSPIEKRLAWRDFLAIKKALDERS